jgi:hypothetical protein
MEFKEKVKLLKKARAYWIWGLILTPFFPVGFVLRYLAVRLIAKVMNNDEISVSYGCGLLFCFIPFLSIPLVTGSLREVGEELDNGSLYLAAVLYSFSAWVLVGAAVLYLFGWSVRSETILNWSMLIGLVGFGSLLWGLVEEAKGVWHLHEVSHKTSEETNSSGVKREYNWVEVERPWLLIASPTGLFIIFLFIWILIMGLGDSKILQDWAGVIGVAGIVFSGFLSWGLVGERERALKEELESERERKKREDYERRCRRWGKYWGMPGFVLLVLHRLKEKEGKEQWEKEEIIKAVIETSKKMIKDHRKELDKFQLLEWVYLSGIDIRGRTDIRREIDRIKQGLDKLDKEDEIIPRIEDALNELVIEGLLYLEGEIYSFRSPWEEFLFPFSTRYIDFSTMYIDDDTLDEVWEDLLEL